MRCAVPGDQALGDVDGFLGLAAVVGVDGFDLLAADAAGIVLLLDGKFGALLFALAGGGGIAAQRAEYADLDGLRGGGCVGGRQDNGSRQRGRVEGQSFAHG